MEKDNECGRDIEKIIDFDFYKTLFEPVRSEILKFLAVQGRKNITEIAESFTQDRSVISRHLELMSRYGILSKTKQSRNTFYEINKDLIIEKFETTTKNLKEIIQK
jgi:predicted transcriptional regulator